MSLQAVEPKLDRAAFWRFCIYASNRVQAIGHTLTAHDIDKLLVDQKWQCAVSKIQFEPPRRGGAPGPFGPSVDRINPGGSYDPTNVRLVCTIVNFAMNQWGEGALRRLVREMKT